MLSLKKIGRTSCIVQHEVHPQHTETYAMPMPNLEWAGNYVVRNVNCGVPKSEDHPIKYINTER